MNKGPHCSHSECLECELPAEERVNFFTGQFLTERDLRAEQDYHIGKHRLHNRRLHGWGTVCGLRVVQHPAPECRDRFVIIEPGLALDCCGHEILVRERIYVDLQKHLAPADPQDPDQDQHLLISLCYAECKTEFVPALYSECGCDNSGCEASRVREGFEVKVERVAELPEQPHHEPVGVSLAWNTTINLENAARLALDTTADRLYVLTSAAPGQVMVYEAGNHCLIRSIDLGSSAFDIELSPSDNFLYVILRDAAGQYSLRVIDVQDIS